MEKLKKCARCKYALPVKSFIGKEGKKSPFCRSCRMEYAMNHVQHKTEEEPSAKRPLVYKLNKGIHRSEDENKAKAAYIDQLVAEYKKRNEDYGFSN